uniref:Uncharacterized protein n=1 Tax=Naja naja TaxID=35670 RepID=A0A8C6XJT9_NAJNA
PTDPHKAAAWPHGFQQLSEVGILQQKALGKFLRERYAGFLSPSYKPQEIYVRSTDYDRTIMSAQANLMGLYPNSHPEIPWKPVPIHTVPAKYDKKTHNMTLPSWATAQVLATLSEIEVFNIEAHVGMHAAQEKARFIGGTIKFELFALFGIKTYTLIALQAALGVYNGHLPPYAACHGFEFYQESNNSFSVAMFYRNRSDQRPYILPLPGCPTPCPLPLFIHLTRTAILKDWDAECQNPQSGPGNEITFPLLSSTDVTLLGMGVLYWRR